MNDHEETRDGRDILISRVIDGEACAAEWDELRILAAADASLWRDVAEAQRLQNVMEHAVACATAAAERTDLPTHDAAGVSLGERLSARAWRFSGWVAAASVALAWGIASTQTSPGTGRGSTNTASLLPVSTPDEAVQAYLDLGAKSGRVVGEMPQRVIMQSRPAQTGRGFEVLYLRQFVERAVVTDLYHADGDDAGGKVLVPVVRPASTRGGSL
jgi:hypothetical protein